MKQQSASSLLDESDSDERGTCTESEAAELQAIEQIPVEVKTFSADGHAHQKTYRKRRRKEKEEDVIKEEDEKVAKSEAERERRMAAMDRQKCPRCSYTTAYPSVLKIHIERQSCVPEEEREKRFACECCEEQFISYNQMRTHVSNKHPLIHKCSECSYTSHKKYYVKKHFQNNHQEGGIPCTITGCKATINRCNLKRHIEEMHCSEMIGGEASDDEDVNDKHLANIQKRERIEIAISCGAFKCPQCEKRFVEAIRMRRHIKRVHEKSYTECTRRRIKKYPCSWTNKDGTKCTKAFTTPGLLEDHLNAHQGLTPYRCTQCDEEFHARARYAVHLNKYHKTSIKVIDCVAKALGID